MTNPYEPPKRESKPIDRLASKNRLLWRGLIVAAIGLLPLSAAYYHATQLVRFPEFRGEFLTNVMGGCFWGGALLFAVGLGIILWSQQK